MEDPCSAPPFAITITTNLLHLSCPLLHPQAVDLGLSGLVEAQLGHPLDKALQCSAWGEVRAAEEWVWQEAAAMAGLAMPRACHDPCHLQWQGRAGQGRA